MRPKSWSNKGEARGGFLFRRLRDRCWNVNVACSRLQQLNGPLHNAVAWTLSPAFEHCADPSVGRGISQKAAVQLRYQDHEVEATLYRQSPCLIRQEINYIASVEAYNNTSSQCANFCAFAIRN